MERLGKTDDDQGIKSVNGKASSRSLMPRINLKWDISLCLAIQVAADTIIAVSMSMIMKKYINELEFGGYVCSPLLLGYVAYTSYGLTVGQYQC